MSKPPRVSESTIARRCGRRSFERGRSYFLDGAVTGKTRQGLILRANCLGSAPSPYRVEITFKGKRIAEADCTCPVGDGGYCKHTAAVLLEWNEAPDTFVEHEPLGDVLAGSDAKTLIAAIASVVRVQPALEPLIRSMLRPGGDEAAAADPASFRRQAGAILDAGDYSYGDEVQIARELMALCRVADAQAASGNHATAAAAYQGIAAAVMDAFEMFHDEGDLSGVIADCVEGLGRCLPKLNGKARSQCLDALLDVYFYDIDWGGIGLADAAPEAIAQVATTQEKRRVCKRIERQRSDAQDDWGQKALAQFLLLLRADTLDDRDFMDFCRQHGLGRELLDRFLSSGRVDDALRQVETAQDHELTWMIDLFDSYRQAKAIEPVIAKRGERSGNHDLCDWMIGRCQKRRDQAAALTWARRSFAGHPHLSSYQRVRKLARQLKQWDQVRPELVKRAQKDSGGYLWVEICLNEGWIDDALAAVESASKDDYARLQVAAAAEKARPDAAIDIYREQAEQLIGRRNRDAYRDACGYLAKVKNLSKKIGRERNWRTYLAALQEEYLRLRALQEEMRTAKLARS